MPELACNSPAELAQLAIREGLMDAWRRRLRGARLSRYSLATSVYDLPSL